MAKAGSERQKRVAVVGSGMAGLVIAHLLHRDPKSQYQVTVFESVSGRTRHFTLIASPRLTIAIEQPARAGWIVRID